MQTDHWKFPTLSRSFFIDGYDRNSRLYIDFNILFWRGVLVDTVGNWGQSRSRQSWTTGRSLKEMSVETERERERRQVLWQTIEKHENEMPGSKGMYQVGTSSSTSLLLFYFIFGFVFIYFILFCLFASFSFLHLATNRGRADLWSIFCVCIQKLWPILASGAKVKINTRWRKPIRTWQCYQLLFVSYTWSSSSMYIYIHLNTCTYRNAVFFPLFCYNRKTRDRQ